MNQTVLFKRCQQIAGAQQKLNRVGLAGFLNRFRPTGRGLSKLYQDVPHGPEIVQRIKAVMKIDGTNSGPHLRVNDPLQVTPSQALAIVEKFHRNMRQWGEEIEDEDVGRFFTTELKINIKQSRRKTFPVSSQMNMAMWSLQGSTYYAIEDCASSSTSAAVMYDAVISLCHDTLLMHYVQWPAFAHCFKTKDPFQPWFDMWRRRITWRLEKGNVVNVFYSQV